MRLTLGQRESMIEAYMKGAKTHDLAVEYGISQVAICGLLSRRSLLKNPSEAQRKYPLDESIFKNIDSEAVAYWLGFLAADGYIYQNSLSLRIASTEIDHIEKFRDWIQPGKPIQTIHSADGTIQVGIEIKSKSLVSDLASHGLLPKKTYTFISRPKMPSELIRHFYRGYVDGDGHVGLSSGKARLDILATEPFLNEFQTWLYEQLGIMPTAVKFDRGMWSIQKCGNRQVPRIVNLLYADCSWHLTRKYNAALNILRLGSNQ